jgi:hypothetical protein
MMAGRASRFGGRPPRVIEYQHEAGVHVITRLRDLSRKRASGWSRRQGPDTPAGLPAQRWNNSPWARSTMTAAHLALMRLEELAALRELGRNANARLDLDFKEPTGNGDAGQE